MNFLKQKFTSLTNSTKSVIKQSRDSVTSRPFSQQQKLPSQKTISSQQLKKQIFQSIKQWDKKRAQTLQRHLQVVEDILVTLEKRVKDSQNYLIVIQGILIARLKELEIYKTNSLNNSSFVLMNHNQPSYQSHFSLLKELVMFQAQKEDGFNNKYKMLKSIFSQLCDYKSSQSFEGFANSRQSLNSLKSKALQNNSITSLQNEQQNPLDESSVAMLKSNVRYLIDCQLPDIIQQTMSLCQQINKTYNLSCLSSPRQDLYILLSKFLYTSNVLVQKHKQIACQLLKLNKQFIDRQKTRSYKVNSTLSKWVTHDKNANELLIRQLQKRANQGLIQDYYDLGDMVMENSMTWIIDSEQNIQDYLRFVHIDNFNRAEELVLFKCSAFYNKKIQAEVIITIDRFLHLRKFNHLDPEFSFALTKEIYISVVDEFVLSIQKIQKKMLNLKAPQRQFEFQLEFNLSDDIERFNDVLREKNFVNFKQK